MSLLFSKIVYARLMTPMYSCARRAHRRALEFVKQFIWTWLLCGQLRLGFRLYIRLKKYSWWNINAYISIKPNAVLQRVMARVSREFYRTDCTNLLLAQITFFRPAISYKLRCITSSRAWIAIWAEYHDFKCNLLEVRLNKNSSIELARKL